MYPNLSALTPLLITTADGPTLTAAAAASMIPTGSKFTLPSGFWFPGKQLIVKMAGRISCAATTPGTARFDMRMGSTVVFDTGALNLNVNAKANVPWWLEILLTCRAAGSGTASNLFGAGIFQSEAVIGSPLPTVGGNGSLLVPTGTPAVGGGFDNTLQNALDFFFTQTVATGSMTLHQLSVWEGQ